MPLDQVIDEMVNILCKSKAYLQQHCFDQLEVLRSYQFALNPLNKNFIVEIKAALHTTTSYDDLTSIHLHIQNTLIPLLDDPNINAHKALLQELHEKYKTLLTMDDISFETSFYTDINLELARLDRGEEGDYITSLTRLNELLNKRLDCVTNQLTQLIESAQQMLKKIFLNKFGQNDQLTVEYMYNQDRLISLSEHDLAAVKHLYLNIQEMVRNLEVPILQKIRRTINKERLRSQERGCLRWNFFSNQQRLNPEVAHDLDIIEDTLSKLSLYSRHEVLAHLETESTDVKKAFRYIAQPKSCWDSRVSPG